MSYKDYEPYEIINGVVVRYKNKKTGRVITALEYEMLKFREVMGFVEKKKRKI